MKTFTKLLLVLIGFAFSTLVVGQTASNYTSLYQCVSKPSTESSPALWTSTTTWNSVPNNQSDKVKISADSYVELNTSWTTTDIFHVFGTLVIKQDLTIGNSSLDTWGYPRFIVWPGGTIIVKQDAILKNNSTAAVQGELHIDGSLDIGGGAGTKLILTGLIEVDDDITGDGSASIVTTDANCSGELFLGGTYDPAKVQISDCLLRIEWTGAVSTDWHNQANWRMRIPDGNFKVTIPSAPKDANNVLTGRFPIISSNTAAVRDLIIESGASVSLQNNQIFNIGRDLTLAATGVLQTDAGTTLNITRNIVVNASGISSGELIVKGNFTQTGTATFYNNLSSTNWHYVSSPTNTGVSGHLYNEAVVDNWVDLLKPEAYSGWGAGTSTAGRGVALNNTSALTFTGSFNHGDVTYTAGYSTSTAGEIYDGWHLVGNPYPCGIDWGGLTKTNLYGAAFILDDGEYEAFVASLVTTPLPPLPEIYTSGVRYLPAGQGFFIQSLTGGGSIKFTNSSKINMQEMLAKRSEDFTDYVYNMLKIKISANGYETVTALRLHQSATEDFDNQIDARKRFSNITNKPELYAITPANEELIISTLPETNAQMSSKLGLWLGVNSTCTIELTDFVQGTVIILKDKLLNTEVNLVDGKYTFTATKGKFNDRFEISVAPPLIWRGTVSDSWNNAANWDKNIVPTALHNVIIPAGSMPLVEGTAVGKNIYLKAGANLTINGTLTVAENITVGAEANRTASIKNNGTLTAANYYIEKYIQANKYALLASPVSGTVDNVSLADKISSYSELNNMWNTQNLTTAQNGEAWKYLPNSDKIIRFKGSHSVNTNGYDIKAQSSDLQSKGVNLIGNPFLAAVDIDKFIETNKNVIDGTVYLYSKESSNCLQFDDYTYTNKMGTVGFGERTSSKKYLKTAEAMFVKALADTKIQFTNAMQIAENELYPAQPVEKSISIRLSLLSPAKQFNETLLAFAANATNAYDNGMDAAKMSKTNSIAIYTLGTDNLKFAIQTLSTSNVTASTIQLGYTALENGKHTLQLSELNKFEHSGIYLKDNQTGSFINLNFEKEYVFETQSGTFDNRLELVFTTVNRWKGTVSKNWHETANWELGIPTETQTVIIPANKTVELSNLANCYDVQIEGDATLIVNSNATLNVAKNILLKAGKQTATVLQNGIINCEKTVVELNKNQGIVTLLSLPLSNAHIRNFEKQWILEAPENDLYFNLLEADNQLSIAKGYRLSFKSNSEILVLDGNMNNGDILQNITNSLNGQKGLNLLGNPYPSAISSDMLLETNSALPMEKAIIRWKDMINSSINFGDYTYWSVVGSVGAANSYQPSSNIALGEGFFVKALSNATLKFTNAMRIASVNDTKRSEIEFSSIKIGLKNKVNQYNEMLVAFSTDASDGFDNQFDATKIENESSNVLFYSLSNETKFAINTLKSVEYAGEKVVKLGFYANLYGTHTLQLIDLSNFDSWVSVQLIDKVANTSMDLRQTTQYSFDVTVPGFDNSRFEIHIKSNAPALCTWNGSVSTAWENAANWTPNLPGSNSMVQIPATANKPIVNSHAVCKSLTISADAHLTINNGSELYVWENVLLKANATSRAMLLEKGTLKVQGIAQVEVFAQSNNTQLLASPIKTSDSAVFESNQIGNYAVQTETSTFTFSGELNSGMVFMPVLECNAGWNKIGNPFTTYLDWNADAGWSRNMLGSTYYYHTDNKIAAYNKALNLGVNGASRYIEPLQGFYVKSYSDGNISVNYQAQLLQKEPVSYTTHNLLRLSLSNAENTDETLLLKTANSTQSSDVHFDSEKMMNLDMSVPQLFTKSLSGNKFVINSQPEFTENSKVELGVRSVNGEQLSISIAENKLQNPYIFLEDRTLNKMVNLKLDQKYDFTASANDESRFVLHFNYQEVTSGLANNDQSLVKIYSNEKSIYVDLNHQFVDALVEVYSINGAKLLNNKLMSQGLNELKLQNVATGLYLVKVISNEMVKVEKVFIR